MEQAGGADDLAYVAVRETLAAMVFLVGDRAYKMKEPVDLGFLDSVPSLFGRRSAIARSS